MTEHNLHIDPQLLHKCSHGDERSLYTLYRLCYTTLYAVCKRYAKDEDEISVQLNNAFVKIVNGLEHYDTKVPFAPWIKRIAINAAIDHFRKERKYKHTIVYPDQSPEEVSDFDFNQAEQMFDAEQLLSLVRKLPPMTMKVFNMAALDGYSHLEIAEMMEISIGTSKWHLFHARKLLREMMEDEMNAHKKVRPRGKKAFKI